MKWMPAKQWMWWHWLGLDCLDRCRSTYNTNLSQSYCPHSCNPGKRLCPTDRSSPGSFFSSQTGGPFWWLVMWIVVGRHTTSLLCGTAGFEFSLEVDRRRREKVDSLTHTNTWSICSIASAPLTWERFIPGFGSCSQSSSLPHQLVTAHPLHTLCCGKLI